MNRERTKFLLMGGLLLTVALLTAVAIHSYDRPGITGKRQAKTPPPSLQLIRQRLEQSAQLVAEKRYPEAERSLRRVLNLDRDNLPALRMLGSVYFLTERYYDASNIFRAILARRPKDPTARNNLGLSMIRMQWYEAGIRELLTARAIDPGQPEINLNLSQVYEELGDTEKAAYYRALAERNSKPSDRKSEPETDAPAEPRESNHE